MDRDPSLSPAGLLSPSSGIRPLYITTLPSAKSENLPPWGFLLPRNTSAKQSSHVANVSFGAKEVLQGPETGGMEWLFKAFTAS